MSQEKAPVISVLMPMRNGQLYLAEAIDSIVNQTFQDWELIIVDNASTDGSAAYARQRAAADPRIRVICNPVNIGVTSSLNKGLGACRGEWIARIDCDDRAMPERLERQLSFVRANADVVVLSCFCYYINPAGQRIARGPHDLTSREAYRRYMQTGELIGILHPGALIKRDAIEAMGGYREEYEPAEDIDLWNRLSERGVVMVLPEYLMDYRLHGSSIVARSMDIAHLKREWAQASMVCRRRGLPEPTWEAVQEQWRKAPLAQKFDRNRRLLVDGLLRRGRQELATGHRVRGYGRLALGAALRPAYTAPRLARHLAPARLIRTSTPRRADQLSPGRGAAPR